MVELLISQIVLCIVNTYIAFTEKKRNIYIATFCFNACNLIMYLFNKDNATAITYISITVRSLLYIFKDNIKSNIVPIGCIVVQICLSASSLDSIWDLLPMVAACWSCWYLWYFNDTQKLRIGNILGNSFWLAYNLYSNLYVACLARIFTICVNTYRYVTKRVKDSNDL